MSILGYKEVLIKEPGSREWSESMLMSQADIDTALKFGYQVRTIPKIKDTDIMEIQYK